MAGNPTLKVAVILSRESVDSRWESHRWQLLGVVPDVGGAPRTLVDEGAVRQRLYPGLEVTLFNDEAEGYFLNVSSEEPSVFVSIRQGEADEEPYPFQCTVSYNEAARWMDGSEKVERAPAWPGLVEWIQAWVGVHYRPEPRRRQRPQSFAGKEGVLREEGEQ
ncbi:MAG TPA: DUF3305 domain-containing protein [Usitatibacter sp.]|nr:DUF3305 domain-containing protein [Usitatibacter sp.]